MRFDPCSSIAARCVLDTTLVLVMFAMLPSLHAKRITLEQPETFDRSFSLPNGGNTIFVNQGDDLQAAFDDAIAGDVIILEAGATFTGNFVLDNKAGTDWIYIISSELDQLPEGQRVGPADAAHMARIVSPDQNPALQTKYGAHNYRIAGIEFSVDHNNYNLILMGFGSENGTFQRANTVEKLPHHITFDRVYIHSTSETNFARTGILADGKYVAVVDSHISNFKDSSDAQAIVVWNGQGPYKIVNNYLEASGENIMFGGEDTAITGLIPADIEIRENHFFKPLAWKDPNLWTFKNLLEFKTGKRVLVSGNVFENSWLDAQVGYAILITPRNDGNSGSDGQGHSARWSGVQDITFEKNIIRSVGQGFLIVGEDKFGPTLQTKNILIENNVFEDVTKDFVSTNRFFTIKSPRVLNHDSTTHGKPVLNLTIRHNTMLHDPAEPGYSAISLANENFLVVENFVLEDNIITNGGYGISAFGAQAEVDSYTNNTITWVAGQSPPSNSSFTNTYGAGNFKANTIADVGFTDYANGDYRLTDSSPYKNAATDGKDVGADIDAVAQATENAEGN